MEVEKIFGLVVREIRIKQHITQEKLAFDSQLDRTYISLLERGLRQPSLSTIIQISQALNQSPEHVVENVMKLLKENNDNKNKK